MNYCSWQINQLYRAAFYSFSLFYSVLFSIPSEVIFVKTVCYTSWWECAWKGVQKCNVQHKLNQSHFLEINRFCIHFKILVPNMAIRETVFNQNMQFLTFIYLFIYLFISFSQPEIPCLVLNFILLSRKESCLLLVWFPFLRLSFCVSHFSAEWVDSSVHHPPSAAFIRLSHLQYVPSHCFCLFFFLVLFSRGCYQFDSIVFLSACIGSRHKCVWMYTDKIWTLTTHYISIGLTPNPAHIHIHLMRLWQWPFEEDQAKRD